MYCKYDNETKKCLEVGTGTNTEFYKSIGMEDLEVEKAYDGSYWLKGYAPSRPQEEIDLENTQTKLNELNQSLNELMTAYNQAVMLGDTALADELKTEYQSLVNGS